MVCHKKNSIMTSLAVELETHILFSFRRGHSSSLRI